MKLARPDLYAIVDRASQFQDIGSHYLLSGGGHVGITGKDAQKDLLVVVAVHEF
jgi:hypothetical protein